jgi:hypothetical protein
LGGTIEVRSRPGEGTRVTVRVTGDLHPPGELPERLSGLFFDHLVELAVITRGTMAVLHEVGKRFDIDQVQLGAGAFGQLDSRSGGQLGLHGAVGRQQDLRAQQIARRYNLSTSFGDGRFVSVLQIARASFGPS